MPFSSFRICIASRGSVPDEEQCLFGMDVMSLSPFTNVSRVVYVTEFESG